jgi:UDP-N-acetyl-2-amino-2-deoxyglucuronate dehydrogenase
MKNFAITGVAGYVAPRHLQRLGADAICEKPLVINPWNLDLLKDLEDESVSKVYTVLQLRLLPSLIKLKKELAAKKNSKKYDVELTYITPRGLWYSYSWKGNPERSGGVSTNIGIHFFDLLLWLFGREQKCEVHISNSNRAGGFIELENANIKWFLSLDKNDIPAHAKESNSTFRSITVDNEEIEFSKSFTDLHTRVYENILDGNGYGIEDTRASIELAYKIRNATSGKNFDCMHPIVKKLLNK